MKVIIAGSRDIVLSITDIDAIVKVSGLEVSEVVSGGMKGVDIYGENWACWRRVPIKRFFPRWDRYGKAAESIRNGWMTSYADALIFVTKHDDLHGKQNIVDHARKRRLKVHTHVV